MLHKPASAAAFQRATMARRFELTVAGDLDSRSARIQTSTVSRERSDGWTSWPRCRDSIRTATRNCATVPSARSIRSGM